MSSADRVPINISDLDKMSPEALKNIIVCVSDNKIDVVSLSEIIEDWDTENSEIKPSDILKEYLAEITANYFEILFVYGSNAHWITTSFDFDQ